jgi:hypothetical protein
MGRNQFPLVTFLSFEKTELFGFIGSTGIYYHILYHQAPFGIIAAMGTTPYFL